MCLETPVSLQGHLLGLCPRLWKLLLPSHSQPQTHSGILEVRALGCSRWGYSLAWYQCPCSQRAPLSRKMPFFSWCRNWGQPLLHVQPHLPFCLQGEGSGRVLPAWLLLTGSTRFPSEFPCFCGLNQNLGAGRVPA